MIESSKHSRSVVDSLPCIKKKIPPVRLQPLYFVLFGSAIIRMVKKFSKKIDLTKLRRSLVVS